MSVETGITATFKNGGIVLPLGVDWPDGPVVRIEAVTAPGPSVWADIVPIGPDAPDYGQCPRCASDRTLARELLPKRVCLHCGFTEDFNTFEESKTGWLKSPPPRDPNLTTQRIAVHYIHKLEEDENTSHGATGSILSP